MNIKDLNLQVGDVFIYNPNPSGHWKVTSLKNGRVYAVKAGGVTGYASESDGAVYSLVSRRYSNDF